LAIVEIHLRCETIGFVDMDHDGDHHEEPPFALSETNHSQTLFFEQTNASSLPSARDARATGFQDVLPRKTAMTSWHASSSPGLTESVMTETSSSCSDSSVALETLYASRMGISLSQSQSSLPSISSTTGITSHCLPNSASVLPVQGLAVELANEQNPETQFTGTFSQLMREIDAHDTPMRKSRMPVVPENESMESSSTGGTLISPPLALPARLPSSSRFLDRTRWLPTALSGKIAHSSALSEPLIDHDDPEEEPFLAVTPSQSEVERAERDIHSILNGDDTFGVSMDLPMQYSVESVLNVVANPDLLRMWCDPIQSLVVTSTSDRPTSSESDESLLTRENIREYEAQWIEATTTALELPPFGMGAIYRAGQAVLDTWGFAQYGKVVMFIERRRGQVGLTMGPFSGGVYATHHIRVCEYEGRIRITDRVRLSRTVEASSWSCMLFYGILDSFMLNSCLLPSLKAYMNQVSTSMARLRILIERIDSTRAVSIASSS